MSDVVERVAVVLLGEKLKLQPDHPLDAGETYRLRAGDANRLAAAVVEALKPTTIDPEDLWDAHQYVLDWMDSDTCDDTPEHRERLKALAKRLKDASNAAALSASPWVGVLSEQGSSE